MEEKLTNYIIIVDLKANDLNLDNYKQYAYNTWEWYCEKHQIELIKLTQPLMDTELMRPTWQRWHIFDVLQANDINQVGRIAMVDIDTMVRWDTPNLFDIVPAYMYGGVKDDLSIEWIWNSIQGYKHLFPNVELEWTSYINNGILVLPEGDASLFCKKVTEFYKDNFQELRKLQHETLRKGTDQTPVNYLAREYFGDKRIFYLPKTYNLTHIYKTDSAIDNIYIKCAYIWHFNGIPRHERENWMAHTWEIIKQNYA